MLPVRHNGLLYFQFDTLPRDGVLAHGVFSRQGGVSNGQVNGLNLSSAVGDDPAHVAENRRRAYGLFGRSVETLVHAHLTHEAGVTQVGRADHGRACPESDGLITDEPGCGLTMNFADCGPICLYDPQRRAVGLGHAGWRGAIADLPGALVRAMQQAFGSDPADLIAALGPCISVSHYEVDEPVISEVQRAFPRWSDRLLVYRRDTAEQPLGRPHFNLALANHIRLYDAGVRRVELPAFCTAARTDLFFSHRAEGGRTGRFGVVVTLAAAQ